MEVHNEFRAEHGVPPLVLSKEISKYSQKWAEDLAKKDALAYSLNQNYGESVYCGWSPDPSTKIKARDCVEKWYSEINNFSFGREPDVLTCGHFTQIVWKGTREVGIGSAKSKSGKLYVVANYYPPGNYSGQFIKNVYPPGANQFKRSNNNQRETNNNLSPPSPSNQRNSKNLSDIASDLVNKFRSSTISSSISNEKFDEEFLKAHNEYL